MSPDGRSDGATLYLESTTGGHAALLADAGGNELARVEWPREASRQDNLDDLFAAVLVGDPGRPAAIVVDVGPGNLATTRASVAYANALGFASAVPIGSVDSLEVMAAVARSGPEPVAGSVLAFRRAGPHGFYSRHGDADGRVSYALVDAARLAALASTAELTICASEADLAAVADRGATVPETAVVTPTVDGVRDVWLGAGRTAGRAVVTPLTETGAVFDVES